MPRFPAKAAASIARRLKVCGHPVRLRLLCAIENRQPCVSDLWHCLGEEQAVVSQHLAVLKRAGIVRSQRERQPEDLLDRRPVREGPRRLPRYGAR